MALEVREMISTVRREWEEEVEGEGSRHCQQQEWKTAAVDEAPFLNDQQISRGNQGS